MSGLPKWLQNLVLLAVALWSGWELLLHNHHLSFVPQAMNVAWVTYVAEKSWGFGPGGNETGIIVYVMPKEVGEALDKDGIAYLKNLPPQGTSGWHGHYETWMETPVLFDSRWPLVKNEGPRVWPVPGIASYLFRYGFSIDIDEKLERQINEALSSKGSYYAYGRIGLIILIPSARRIVYAYSG